MNAILDMLGSDALFVTAILGIGVSVSVIFIDSYMTSRRKQKYILKIPTKITEIKQNKEQDKIEHDKIKEDHNNNSWRGI
jgi:hypothetical protein